MGGLPRGFALFLLCLAAPLQAQQDAAPRPEVPAQLAEAANALAQGRTLQARTMLGEAVRLGARGDAVDRLLADLDFAEGRYEQALTRATMLLLAHPDDFILLERAGLSALALGRDRDGIAYLERAERLGTTRWRTYNGLGVAHDRHGAWAAAARAYDRAAALAPSSPEVANNRGWSLLLQGRWEEAVGALTRAVGMDSENQLYRANLDLALMALDDDLPRRLDGESDDAFAARLNDAGVVAAAQGLRRKAIAAFTRAIEANSQYYRRAADNLARLGGN